MASEFAFTATFEIFPDFKNGEHAAHADGAKRPISAHHGEGICRALHIHFCHFMHSVLAHRHIFRKLFTDFVYNIVLIHPEHILVFMPHRIHGMMTAVAMQSPVSGFISNKLDISCLTGKNNNGCFWILR